MAPHTITSVVGAVFRCKAKRGLMRLPRVLHIRTRLSSLLRLNVDSRAAKDDLVPFRYRPVSSCAAPLQAKMSTGGLQGQRDHKCPSAWFLRMVLEDTGALVKVLHVPGWRPMKLLAVLVQLLRCGSLLKDWSFEGVLNLVFV
ncbi:e3 ubiquitin-protein ligase RNF13 [Trichonephila clavipes]|uniref:E3 ubiquitin-protein ligase RNF13 n=1 Tax=Trichonephila clavipes TaxID=2585209 RepID=A0A8X6RPS0_TRICX|nr:e3 ubiquitin-protein ligase RNF13 [Trichonephila clavipes]